MEKKVDIDVKIISRENIKPSSPTPLHLKTFNLSSFDFVYSTNLYPSFLIFYPNLDHYDHNNHDQDRRVHELKSSLSKTLTLFYPLAGRFIENEPFVDCNDEGAHFIEAKVSGSLSDILKHPDSEVLSQLLPTKIVSVQDTGFILLVQTNLFECGGLGVGFSVAHRLMDAYTVNLFVKGWAAQARGGSDVIEPDLTAIASRFPAVASGVRNDSSQMSSLKTKSFKTRRFVFDSKSINDLKAKATSASLQRPSRVEVVAGHIWQSTMKLSSRNNTQKTSHLMVQTINLRPRTDPPLPNNSFGNLIDYSYVLMPRIEVIDKVPGLDGLIGEFRKAIQCAIKGFAKKNARQDTFLENHEQKEQMRSSSSKKEDVEMDMILMTSGCRLGFYENSDFGWGEPVWFTLCGFQNKCSSVALLDTKDGDGIQAWVTLEEHVLDLLETDQNFLEFASVNPTINLP